MIFKVAKMLKHNLTRGLLSNTPVGVMNTHAGSIVPDDKAAAGVGNAAGSRNLQ